MARGPFGNWLSQSGTQHLKKTDGHQIIMDINPKALHPLDLRKKGRTHFLALALLFLAVSCSYSGFNREEGEQMMPPQLVGDTPYIPTNGALPFLHSLGDIVLGNPEYGAVAAMLRKYGALPYLEQLKDVTLLLPVGREFDARTNAQLEEIYAQQGPQGIIMLLQEHSAVGRYDSARLMSRTANRAFEVSTLAQTFLTFSFNEDAFQVVHPKAQGATITMPDQRGTNGVLHGITHWLLPNPSLGHAMQAR